jgi:hypothetical protein
MFVAIARMVRGFRIGWSDSEFQVLALSVLFIVLGGTAF